MLRGPHRSLFLGLWSVPTLRLQDTPTQQHLDLQALGPWAALCVSDPVWKGEACPHSAPSPAGQEGAEEAWTQC